ncbi:hypothetical protein S83_055383, partial [Arachis hypogaea]
IAALNQLRNIFGILDWTNTKQKPFHLIGVAILSSSPSAVSLVPFSRRRNPLHPPLQQASAAAQQSSAAAQPASPAAAQHAYPPPQPNFLL